MSISSVREYFRKLGIEDKVMEFDVSSATVELAAAALGCEGQRIGKTMAFIVDDRPILIVVAGDARIANPKFKGRFHTKARMIAPDRLDELVGHEIGQLCTQFLPTCEKGLFFFIFCKEIFTGIKLIFLFRCQGGKIDFVRRRSQT